MPLFHLDLTLEKEDDDMQESSYFSRKLTGGAISQRGFRYQTLVAIKYLMESMNDLSFIGIAIEQEDDFSLHFENSPIYTNGLVFQCQVKSVMYGIGDLRDYLDSKITNSGMRILICSAFSNDVQSLLENRKWYRQRVPDDSVCNTQNREEISKEYREQLKKKQIDFDVFQSVKFDSIPVDYAEAIARNTIESWAQKNKQSINTEALMEALYIEVSRIASVRGQLKRTEIMGIIDRCIETKNKVYTHLSLKDLDSKYRLTSESIYYTEKRTAKSVCIYPKLQYWDDIVNNQKPMIPKIYEHTPFHLEFPNLDFKVLNGTNKTLFLTAVEFIIVSSKPDPSPIVVIQQPYLCSNKRHLHLRNEGWGPLKNVRIRINSSPVKNSDYVNWGASAYLGMIDDQKNVDLTEMLQEITGIDFEEFEQAAIRENLYCPDTMCWATPDSNYDFFRGYLGEYSNGIAYVNGILDFDADTIEKQNRHYEITFSAEIDLFDYWITGMYKEPSYQYDIRLRVSGEAYTVRKSISQVLAPGETDRFNVRIHCDQSARHIMDICLVDITGSKIPIESGVQIDVCIPRSGADYACDHDMSIKMLDIEDINTWEWSDEL